MPLSLASYDGPDEWREVKVSPVFKRVNNYNNSNPIKTQLVALKYLYPLIENLLNFSMASEVKVLVKRSWFSLCTI